MRAAECETAAVETTPRSQPYRRVTEEQEKEVRMEATHRKWSGRLLVMSCVLPLIALAAWGVNIAWPHFSGASEKARSERLKALMGTPAALSPEAENVVRRFLKARSVDEYRPLVAEESRVAALLDWYADRFTPEPVEGNIKIVRADEISAQRRRVQAATEKHPAIWLVLVNEAGSWKVDWELFSTAPALRWSSFLRERAGAIVELPLLAALMPGAGAWIREAGASPEKCQAVTMNALGGDGAAGAILVKDLPLWNDLDGIGFDRAVKLIVRARMENPALDPPLVSLETIVRRGWEPGESGRAE
jgi:hypothetical protein